MEESDELEQSLANERLLSQRDVTPRPNLAASSTFEAGQAIGEVTMAQLFKTQDVTNCDSPQVTDEKKFHYRPPPRCPPMNNPEVQQSTGGAPDRLDRLLQAMEVYFTRTNNTPPAAISAAPNQTYVYSGLAEEDPVEFLEAMEEHMIGQRINSDRDMVTFVRGQLRGDARKWVDTFRVMFMPYDTFRECFLERFDSPDHQAVANTMFFSEKQGEMESAEAFISRKRALMNRLKPNITTATAVAMLTNLLVPHVGNILRGTRPESLDELMKLATRIERGTFKDKRQPASTETPAVNKKPATPCRYCQAWHYHKDCPENPFKRQQQENWREAGANSRRIPPPATSNTAQPQRGTATSFTNQQR